MLFHLIFNHLDKNVEVLDIFCDSCGGQNKNYTIFRMLHFIVHKTGRLRKIKMTPGRRTHSYLECDLNMGIINQKATVELPFGWNEQIVDARAKPSPFMVVDCEQQDIFRSWTNHLKDDFYKKCPFESRPIKELIISKENPRIMEYRETHNGAWTTSVVIPPKRKQETNERLPADQFEVPSLKYTDLLPISTEKYANLQYLKRFCEDPQASNYYQSLPHTNSTTGMTD
nr:unnamed protein product [Callosobruchus chinensis]